MDLNVGIVIENSKLTMDYKQPWPLPIETLKVDREHVGGGESTNCRKRRRYHIWKDSKEGDPVW